MEQRRAEAGARVHRGHARVGPSGVSAGSSAPPLLVVGYANVDLIARLPETARPGRRLTVERIEVAPGGMAANTACVVASLGSPVALYAAVGDDCFGRFLLDAWAVCGVDAGHVLRSDTRATTKCLISVCADGERTIISEAIAFDYGHLWTSLSKDRFPNGTIVYFDGYRLSDFNEAADLARKRGCAVAADLDGCEDARVLSEALPLLDIVFSNRSTLARLVGDLPLPQALSEIAARGPRVVIGTSGREGAWILSGGSTTHVEGHAVDVVDTTGAGDTFDGAFLHAYGLSLDELWSTRYANAAAAISTSGTGALGHIPTDSEIRRLLAG